MDKRPNLDGIASEIQNYIFHLEKKLKSKNLQLAQLNSQINDLRNTVQKLTVENDKFHLIITSIENKDTKDEDEASIDLTEDHEEEEDNSKNVVIKGLDNCVLNSNLINVVINIAGEMKLKLSKEDISFVRVLERSFYQRLNIEPNTTTLVVQFKRQEVKVKFLKHKKTLQSRANKICKNLQIQDYVSEDTYNLYTYTRSLKLLGYASVYWRNNSVFVKKTDSSDSEEIEIHNTSEADALIESFDKTNNK